MRISLVQRGTFREDLKDSDITGIDSVVRFDYMGSAEFEFGALPASLKNFLPNLDCFNVHETSYKSFDNLKLILFCPNEIFDYVINGLIIMTQKQKAQGHIELPEQKNSVSVFLKENTLLYNSLNNINVSKFSRINFWWDIENNWFAILDDDKHSRTQNLKTGLERLKERWIKEKKI